MKFAKELFVVILLGVVLIYIPAVAILLKIDSLLIVPFVALSVVFANNLVGQKLFKDANPIRLTAEALRITGFALLINIFTSTSSDRIVVSGGVFILLSLLSKWIVRYLYLEDMRYATSTLLISVGAIVLVTVESVAQKTVIMFGEEAFRALFVVGVGMIFVGSYRLVRQIVVDFKNQR